MSAGGNLTLAEKQRERRRRREKEADKEARERAAREAGRPPPSAAAKYGGALCKYAWRGNVRRMERCVRKGASPEYAHPISLARPLHRAALGGSLAAVRWLAETHAARLDVPDDEEWRPLHVAASKGHADIAAYLLARGAEPDAKDALGNTPLHLAAAKGHAETVEALLAGGAAPAVANAAGRLPAQVAATRRIARTLAGLPRDLDEEAREDPVTGELRDLESAEPRSDALEMASSKEEGQFFDATTLYGFEHSSDED